jgi:hypothetical protein
VSEPAARHRQGLTAIHEDATMTLSSVDTSRCESEAPLWPTCDRAAHALALVGAGGFGS